MSKTPFSDQVVILHDLYIYHRDEDQLQDFFASYDLGVPLAVLVNQGCATATDNGIRWVQDAFDGFCNLLGIEDTGFSTIDEMVDDDAER